MCPGIVSAVFAVTAAVGTAGSIYSGQQAASSQRDAMKLERKRQALEESKQKREMVRASRISFANASQAAEQQGASGSSSSLGGLGSIRSQLNSNMSFLDQYGGLSDRITKANISASSWMSTANLFSDIAQIGAAGFANSDKIAAQGKKIFGG